MAGRSTVLARALCVAILVYGGIFLAVARSSSSWGTYSQSVSLLVVGGLTAMAVGFLVPYLASMLRHRQTGGEHRAHPPTTRVRWRDWLPLVPCGAALLATAILTVVA
jgi:hypothetical protein